MSFHIDPPAEAQYLFRVIAWGSDYRDGVAAKDGDSWSNELSPDTAGARAITSQIQHLHKLMLGEDLASTDPEISAVYQLLVETWQSAKHTQTTDEAWSSPMRNAYSRGRLIKMNGTPWAMTRTK